LATRQVQRKATQPPGETANASPHPPPRRKLVWTRRRLLRGGSRHASVEPASMMGQNSGVEGPTATRSGMNFVAALRGGGCAGSSLPPVAHTPLHISGASGVNSLDSDISRGRLPSPPIWDHRAERKPSPGPFDDHRDVEAGGPGPFYPVQYQ